MLPPLNGWRVPRRPRLLVVPLTLLAMLAGLLVAALPAFAAVPVSGTVSAGDPAGPVEQASLTLLQGGSPVAFGVTDQDGEYQLDHDVDAGTYELVVDPPSGFPDGVRTTEELVVGSEPVTRNVVLTAPTLVGQVNESDGTTHHDSARVRIFDLTVGELVTDSTGLQTDQDGLFYAALRPGHDYRITAWRAFGSTLTDLATSVVVPGDTAELTLTLVDVDGAPWSSEEVLEGNTNGDTSSVRVSDDGSVVAVADSGDDSSQVFAGAPGEMALVSTTPGGEAGDGDSIDPALAGDGSAIAFRSTAPDLLDGDPLALPQLRLYWRELPAGPVEQVFDGVALSAPSISTDGDSLVFVGDDGDDPDGGVLYRATRGTGGTWTTTVLDEGGTSLEVAHPVLSGDGSTVAYYTRATGESWQLRTRPIAGGGATAPVLVDSRADADLPAFVLAPPSITEDGDTVVYTSWSRVDEPGEVDDRDDATLMRLDGGNASPLFDGSPLGFGFEDPSRTCPGAHGPQVSDDGSTVFFLACTLGGEPSAADQLWSRPLDGSRAATLVSTEKRGLEVFSPPSRADVDRTGAHVAFLSNSREVVGGEREFGTGTTRAFLASARADAEPPVWPGDAVLTADPVGARSLTLSWPAASDVGGVREYVVERTGVPDIVTSARSLVVTGLEPETEYTFTVQATDTVGNTSDDGPSVTVTTAALGTTAVLQVQPSGKDGFTLTWDDGDGESAYRVYRARGTADPVEIVELPAGTTTYVDTGLDAGTSYTYRIIRVVDGVEEPHTGTVSATTPLLGDVRTTVTVPQLSAGLARLGGDLLIRVVGDPRRDASALVTVVEPYDEDGALLDTPVEREIEVDLTPADDDPGIYDGEFTLDEGIATVVSVVGVLEDRSGTAVRSAAAGFPVPVSGAAAVTVEAGPAAFPGGRLRLSDGTAAGTTERAVPLLARDQDRTETVPLRPGMYDVTLLPNGDSARFEVRGGVLAGRTTPLTLAPDYPAELTVEIEAPGQEVTGSKVELRESGVGLVGAVLLADQQRDATFPSLRSGQQYDVSIVPGPDTEIEDAALTRVLVPGPQTVTLSPGTLDPGPISGVVKRSDGSPLPRARVSAVQVVEGRTFTSETVTNSNGAYSLDTLAGSEVTVRASARGETQTEVVSAPAENVDFQMTSPVTYPLEIELRVPPPGGGSASSLFPDWRSAAHYSLRIRTPLQELGYGALLEAVPGEPQLEVAGRPGDDVTVCANGVKVRLLDREVCTTVELPAVGQDVRVTVTLPAGPVVLGEILAGDGTPYLDDWYAVLRDVDGESLYRAGRGSELVASLERAGTYTLQVFGRGQATHAPVQVTVGAQGETTLDAPVRLVQPSGFSALSQVTTSTPEVLPGGLARFRVRAVAPAPRSDAAVVVTVPDGTTVAPIGVTLDGEPVEDPEVTDGRLIVPLGDMVGLGERIVTVALDTGDLDPGADVLPGVAIRSRESGDSFLDVPRIRMVGISLQAPGTTASDTVALSGRTLPDALVEVFDGGESIGFAQATPGGAWRTTVTLGALQRVGRHYLTAVATRAGQRLVSEPTIVTFDPDQPVVSQVEIFQEENGRRLRSVTYDPRQGVHRFPFVLQIAAPLQVRARFTFPERIRAVRATFGGHTYDMTQRNGVWEAEGPGTNGTGVVSFDYTVAPLDITSSRYVEDPEERRRALGPLLEDVVSTGGPTEEDPDAPFVFDFPTQGLQGELTVEELGTIEYTATAEDIALSQAIGAPLVNVSIDIDPDTGIASMTGYVPPSFLQGAAPRQVGRVIVPAGRAVWAGVKASWRWLGRSNEGSQLAQTVEGAGTINDAVSAKNGPYPDIDALTSQLQAYALQTCLRDPRLSFLQGRIDALRNEARALDTIGLGIGLAGAILAPATFGASLGLTVLGAGIGLVSNEKINRRIAEVETLIFNAAQESSCKTPRQKLIEFLGYNPFSSSSGPTGQGTDIHDPSGFLYEGAPSKRVEGAVATLTYSESEDGDYTFWDAEWFEQINPQVTGSNGRYGWDVPEGWYRVLYTAEGYEPAMSRKLEVLPPHFDVDIPMVPLALPELDTVTAEGTASLLVTFSQSMDAGSVPDAMTVTRGDDVVPGAWVPVSPEVSPAFGDLIPEDLQVADTFRFVPTSAFTSGVPLTVTATSAAENFAGRPLVSAEQSQDVTPTGGGGPVGPQPTTGTPTATASPTGSPTASPTGSPTATGSPTTSPTVTTSPTATATPTDPPDPEPETNRPPRAQGDAVTTSQGRKVRIKVLGNDRDRDRDRLRIVGVGDPDQGRARAKGRFVVYRPERGFCGVDSFRYRVGDGNGGRSTAFVSVRVRCR